MTDLNTLADRVEVAEPVMQAALLEAAWEALAEASAEFRRFTIMPCDGFGNNAGKFGTMMDAHAFTDAALLLVPEGWVWMTGCNAGTELPPGKPQHGFFATMAQLDDEADDASDVTTNAATHALALVAAALRARGSKAMTEAERIADGLTKAQREAIIGATDLMSNHAGYPFFAARYTGDAWPKGIATFLLLRADRLTPLGLQVRAILQQREGGEG